MRLKHEIVHIDVAEPATFREIAAYLFTAGRYGRVFRAKRERFVEWRAPEHVNCRCQRVTIDHGGDER